MPLLVHFSEPRMWDPQAGLRLLFTDSAPWTCLTPGQRWVDAGQELAAGRALPGWPVRIGRRGPEEGLFHATTVTWPPSSQTWLYLEANTNRVLIVLGFYVCVCVCTRVRVELYCLGMVFT